MQKILPSVLLLAIPLVCFSQSTTITLDYDNNGNQVLVEIEGTGSDLDIETISSLIYVYPNPVYSWGNYGYSYMTWDASVDTMIQSIRLIRPDIGLDQLQTILTNNEIRRSHVSFSGPHGYYYLKIKLTDGREVTKKLLKQ